MTSIQSSCSQNIEHHSNFSKKIAFGSVQVNAIFYNEDSFTELENIRVSDCFAMIQDVKMCWIQVIGVYQQNVIEEIASEAGLHPLVLEDIVHTRQRSKIEDYNNFLFIVLRLLTLKSAGHKVENQQISLILEDRLLISFEEKKSTIFDGIKDRLKQNRGLIRKVGIDFLAYAIIDTIIDQYFCVIEELGRRLDDLENKLVKGVSQESLGEIHAVRREVVLLRRFLWPLREVINHLERANSKLITDITHVYLRDVYDHILQVLETIDSQRDLITGLIDIYLSRQNNKMNEVIKILTVVTSIFVPLTFIASFYGMNFKNMPELELKWAYPVVITTMIVVTLMMIVYIRRKKWL